MAGRLQPNTVEYDVMAQALNERLHDLGRDWPVPYRGAV